MKLEERTKTVSMCMNVEGFMKNNKYPRDYGIFEQDDGTPLRPDEALAFLKEEQAKGHKVIPCSGECGNPCKHSDRGCKGFDYSGGGCPGRYMNLDTSIEREPSANTSKEDTFAKCRTCRAPDAGLCGQCWD